jgi:hypothetical protein
MYKSELIDVCYILVTKSNSEKELQQAYPTLVFYSLLSIYMDPFKFQKISSYSNTYYDNILNGYKLLTALQFTVKEYYVSCLH